MKRKLIVVIVIILAVVIAAGIISSAVFVTVPTGHTGVVTTFGRVEEYVLDEGIHMKLPWQDVIKMDNRAQKQTITLQAFSSDIQQVDVIVSVNFSVDRETSQNLYRNVGAAYFTTVIEPRIYENTKAVFVKYSAENLVAERAKLSGEVAELMRSGMKAYGVELLNISIENIDFTDEFTNAVEAKQVAEQSKLQATIEQDQKVMEAQKDAERQVIAANADSDVKKIAADADAYAVEVKAQAEAEANTKIAASLTDNLIKYQQVQQWNGQLPQYYGSNGVLPILDVAGTESSQAD